MATYEDRLEYQKKYYYAHREERIAYQRKQYYIKKNSEEVLEWRKKYRTTDKYKEYHRNWHRNSRQNKKQMSDAEKQMSDAEKQMSDAEKKRKEYHKQYYSKRKQAKLELEELKNILLPPPLHLLCDEVSIIPSLSNTDDIIQPPLEFL